MSGIDYGNARVRALKAGLLDGPAYRSLAAADLDALIAALADTAYRADLQAATPRFGGLRRLEEALRTNLGRTLAMLPGWYDGADADGIRTVLSRWDLRNARTILRGAYGHSPPDEIVALLVPAGSLGESILAELAESPDLRTVVEQMVVRSVPSTAVARAVLETWPDYATTGDLRTLEHALHLGHARELVFRMAALDPVVSRVLRRELDGTNILTALRLQAAASTVGELGAVEAEEELLPGGEIPLAVLAAAARADEASTAASTLHGSAMPPEWREPIASYGRSGALGALADALDAAQARTNAGMFATGDPLGIAVPVAFVWAKENEVRNLRVLGSGLAGGIPADMIEDDLVILW